MFAALPAFAADERARVHAFCHAVPGGWHAMGVMLSAAGSLLVWYGRLVGRDPDELIASALEGARDVAGLEPGAKVVITAGRAGIPGGTNLIMIREVPEPGGRTLSS